MPAEWYPSDNCNKNCTCTNTGLLKCVDWCDKLLRECKEGDKMLRTEYGGYVGDKGCRKCIIYACDAISKCCFAFVKDTFAEYKAEECGAPPPPHRSFKNGKLYIVGKKMYRRLIKIQFSYLKNILISPL